MALGGCSIYPLLPNCIFLLLTLSLSCSRPPCSRHSCSHFQLAAKEAYLQAKAEIADEDRRRILAEFRTLIQEAATTAAEAATEKVASTAAEAAALAAAESAVGKAAGDAGSSISNGGVGDEPGTEISDEDAAAAVAAAEAAASSSDKGVEVTR